MNNKKVKEIINFSLYKNIQNKWFNIFNILTLIGIIAIINGGSLFSLLDRQTSVNTFNVAVLDHENLIYDNFKNDLSGEPKLEINRISTNEYTSENIPDDLIIIEVSGDNEECIKVAIISKEGISTSIYKPIENELYKLRNNLFIKKYGVSGDILEVVQHDLSVKRVMLSVNSENSNTKELIKLFSAAITYFITILIFSKIANEIASEKQSKSTEYILTTVSAKEYLFAKIFSNVLWLILQGLLIIVYYAISILIFNFNKAITTDFTLTSSIITSNINKEIVFYVITLIAYNILTLILLSIIQATLASKTSSTSEAGNTVSVLLFVMLVAYISTVTFLSPYSKVNVFLYIISCIPPLSAYFVPGMMVIGQATIAQIIISLAILVISIPFVFNYCSKIFKNGILDYTKSKKSNKVKIKDDSRKDFLNKREMKHFGFVIGIAIIIYVGTQTIFSLIGSLVLSTLFKNILSDTDITMILQILLQVISLGLASMFIFAFCDNNVQKADISAKSKFKILLVALFIVFILQIIFSFVLYPIIGLDYETTDLFKVDASSSIVSKIILVIALAIIPGFFEELFFRKAIINFSIKYGKTFALLFSAILFGALHMNLSQGLFAFIIGLLWASIYIYTGDIKISMTIHMINNGIAALQLILPEIASIAVIAVFFIVIIIGFVILIKALLKKDIRNKIIITCKKNINLQAFVEKYKYIFADYTFDISLVLILLMSSLTEKILR